MLNSKEIETIDHSIKKIKDDFQSLDENFINLSVINENKFFESGFAKKYFKDKSKLFMYYNVINSGGRKLKIQKG